MKQGMTVAAFAVCFLAASTAQAADPDVKCESGKLKEASKYASCRLKADSKAVKKGEVSADYSKCETKFSVKWGRLEEKAGSAVCPSEGDQVPMDTRITTDAAEIATLLAGGTVAPSNPCNLLQFPASGELTAFGADSDGEVQAGAALSYTDNGDGTITDNNTGLMWEKKDDNPSPTIHDIDNKYTWSTGTNDMDGEITTVFLHALNDVGGGGASCFAGYCDWRIPNSREGFSILDFELEALMPIVDPAFHQSGTCAGCTDVTLATCSCTEPSYYWSSTTLERQGALDPDGAAIVNFGGVQDSTGRLKTNEWHVRAVRGGL